MHYRFAFFTLSSFFITLLAVIVFNISVDSTGIFRPSQLKSAAKDLINGNNIAMIGNIDERLFQLYLIESMPHTPHTIALGSSRIMDLHKTSLKGEKEFYNHGVSGANIWDYYAILGLYMIHKGVLPKRIIFGLDPWVLNANNGDMRFTSIVNGLHTMNLILLGKKQPQKESALSLKAKEALSFAQTKNNIKAVFTGDIFKQKAFIVPTTDTEYSVKGIDASSYIPLHARNPNVEAIKKGVYDFRHYHITNFDTLDTAPFLKLMEYLQSQNIDIIFYLPPYNPMLYDLLLADSNAQNIFKAQDFIKEYAKTHNIPLYGDYNPSRLGAEFEDFLDGAHLKADFVQSLFEKYDVSLHHPTPPK